MTTSNYMPDVVVEIAFNAGYSTPTASRTWTDVSAYVELKEGLNITYGRQDEFGVAEPNTLSLTLDNRDGRFTAGKTGGAYYPNVKIGRPIRVTSTPVGGAASVRFLGFVEEWPVAWDGSDNYAKAKITALSRMARLGLDAPLRSIVQEEILNSTPIAYWPLNDPVGSVTVANAVAGSNTLGLFGDGSPLTFGADVELAGDPGTGIRTSSTGGTNYLYGPLAAGISTAHPATIGVEVFVTDASTTAPGGTGMVALYGNTSLGGGSFHIDFDTTEFYVLYSDSVGGIGTVIGGVPTGRAVHVAGILTTTGASTATLDLYVNGALVGSSALTGLTPTTLNHAYVGFAGTGSVRLGHAAVTTTATNVLERAKAGMTGFYGETAGERIARLARYAGVLSNEVSSSTSTQAVSAIDTTDLTALEVMRKVESVEDGVLHDSRDGVLTLFSRASRFYTTSAFTLTADQVESDVSPKLDRSTLVNDITATAQDGTSSRSSDATSIAAYGYARQSLDIPGTAADAATAAAWAVLRFAEPLNRIPALSVDLLPCNSTLQGNLMAADIGTRLTVSSLPTQAPASSIDFFIEGYTESIGQESYRFTFNVFPVDATTDLPFWILNDATYGIYDARTIAY